MVVLNYPTSIDPDPFYKWFRALKYESSTGIKTQSALRWLNHQRGREVPFIRNVGKRLSESPWKPKISCSIRKSNFLSQNLLLDSFLCSEYNISKFLINVKPDPFVLRIWHGPGQKALRTPAVNRESQHSFSRIGSMVALLCNEKKNQYGFCNRAERKDVTVN